MNEQWWSWALTAVGVACFWLAGRKVWWSWYVGLGGQVTWLAYSLITEQWGFLVGVGVYSAVYARNAYTWTRDRHGYVTRAKPPGRPPQFLVQEDRSRG